MMYFLLCTQQPGFIYLSLENNLEIIYKNNWNQIEILYMLPCSCRTAVTHYSKRVQENLGKFYSILQEVFLIKYKIK
jgi:hypothetical protein